MKIHQMHVLIGLVELACFGRLCEQAPLDTSCLEIADSEDSVVRTRVFFFAVWFQRERIEPLLVVNIMEHAFVPWYWRKMPLMLRSED
jgi:hypothetical protein